MLFTHDYTCAWSHAQVQWMSA